MNVSLRTDDTQMVYTQLNAEILPCPPGLQFDNANKNCVCGEWFSGNVFCNQNAFRSFIVIGYCMSYGINNEAKEFDGCCPFTLAEKKIEPALQLPMLPDQLDKEFCGPQNRIPMWEMHCTLLFCNINFLNVSHAEV